MNRPLLLVVPLLFAAAISYSQEVPVPEVVALLKEDPDRCAVNMHVYEFDPIVDTKPPRGYKPFYISHYGRHGTRTENSGEEYLYVVRRLEKADSLGILTDEGKNLLEEAKAVFEAFGGREGRLTPRGEREHRMLAERMYRRFPDVFKKGPAKVRVQSSVVPRCLVSMASFISKLSALSPRLQFSIVSDNKAQKLLTNDCSKENRKEASRMVRPIWKADVDTVKILTRLFTDPVAARQVVDNAGRLQRRICATATVAKNLDLDFDIFRHLEMDVIYQHFDANNRHIYLTQCNSVEFGDVRMPRIAEIVEAIARQADDAIESGEVAADLRFGHDWPYMAIVSYLGLEGPGDQMSMDEIPYKWFGPRYICLACNLQMVFYRSRKGPVLVKFLVNEKETLLRGLEPVQGPYYDWALVRENLDGWRRAGEHIRTVWADEVSPSNAHPEYPRPQMIRPRWKSLNGLWDYAIAPVDAPQPATPDGKILVPFCVESSLSGVGRRVGADSTLWYRCEFKVPSAWKEKVLLHFDAVDWRAEVWLNGKPLGEHTGGYTAFAFDISDYLVKGRQELVVKVWDGTDNDMQPRGKQVSKPGGIWYTPVTGIWQSVWLEPVGQTFIKDYNCTSSLSGNITVTTDIEGEADAVRVTLYEGAEGWDAEHGTTGERIVMAQAEPGQALVLKVPDVRLWSPEHPYLYALSIEVVKGGTVLDKVKAYTAIRSCTEVMDDNGHKRLGLNGKPCFQYGPLDQGWWPDGLYTAPTDEALAYDIVKAKDWGYNFIRKHIKVEPARWYYHCDRLGMMVWQDMPSVAENIHVAKDDPNKQWGRKAYDTGWDYPLSETAKATFYREWGEIIDQLKKFPCIVVWVPFNEGWGQFDTEAVVAYTREQDPSRLINSASGGNHRHCGDILDSHNYPRPKMLLRSDGEQIDVIGEYGGIGYAVPGHTWQREGNWGYKGICENGGQVLEKYRHYCEDYLIPGIADGISAAVYTQTTDVEVEVNGLMTYDRKVIKIDEEQLRKVNLKVIESL